MIKEIIILAVAVLALCHAMPRVEPQPTPVPEALPAADEDQQSDDLATDATAWYGGGWGRRYYGGGWSRPYYGRGWGGYGGWGYGGYGGWGKRRYYW